GNTVLADGILVQAIGRNDGSDDDFHVQAGSPTIDAGNPATPYILEPSPNGGRVNLGFDGDTAQAQTSAAQTLQILNPADLGKYEVGQQVRIDVDSAGLLQSQAVLLINAGGGGAIATPTQGTWQADADETTSYSTFTNTAS